MPQRGVHSVTVPGVVAGWEALRERFGRLDLADDCWPRPSTTPTRGSRSPRSPPAVGGRSVSCSRRPRAPRETFLVDGRAPAAGRGLPQPRPGGDAAPHRRRTGATASTAAPSPRPSWTLLARAGRHDDARRPRGVRAGVGRRRSRPPIAAGRWPRFRPQGQGIAALMMLNLMERFPLGEFGLPQPARAARHDRGEEAGLRRHARATSAIRASARVPVADAARQGVARADAGVGSSIRRGPPAASTPSRLAGRSTGGEGRRHHLPDRGRSRRQHRLAHPEQLQRVRLRASCAEGRRLHAAQPRRALHAGAGAARTRSRRASGRCTRSSRASWRRTTSASASGSWAAGTRPRPTRSSSPTSSTTA